MLSCYQREKGFSANSFLVNQISEVYPSRNKATTFTIAESTNRVADSSDGDRIRGTLQNSQSWEQI